MSVNSAGRNHLKKLTHFPVCIFGGGPTALLGSILLSDMGVKHCIIERQPFQLTHSRPTFVNNRTMEILRAHSMQSFQAVMKKMVPSTQWRLAKTILPTQFFSQLTNLVHHAGILYIVPLVKSMLE